MNPFQYRHGKLWVEEVLVTAITEQLGTPCYIYAQSAIKAQLSAFQTGLADYPNLICYAVKANPNIALLRLLSEWGAGFDVVSGGELLRALHAGAKPESIVFSGVAKTEDEIAQAIHHQIRCINVESEQELFRIQAISQEKNTITPVSIRLNPDIDPQTHPYISTGLKANKFGIEAPLAKLLYQRHSHFPNLKFIGLNCHIGSQLTQLSPFIDALACLLSFADELKADCGLKLEHVDIGGGLGVCYQDEQPPSIETWMDTIKAQWKTRPYQIMMEPGRSIIAKAGILVTQVQYIKPHHEKLFAITDAAMNDFMRPALYQAWHRILPIEENQTESLQRYDVVGGVCESSDFFGHHRALSIHPNSLLAICDTGAYGASMSSHYNSRPKIPEVIVDGNHYHVIRARESFEDLIQHECFISTTGHSN